MKIFTLRILRKLGFLKYFSFKLKVKINDVKFKIPVINEVGLREHYFRTSEAWMLFLLNKMRKKYFTDKSFIDVGVNVGQTLLKVKSISRDVNYIGFEPNPFCMGYIDSLIKLNKLKNVIIYPVGIGDKNSIEMLELSNKSNVGSGASIIKEFRGKKNDSLLYPVPIFKYSSIMGLENIEIGCLKIDVEGSELGVIRGFKNDIGRSRPLIILEVLPVYNQEKYKARMDRQIELEKILRELNYVTFRIYKKNKKYDRIKKIDSIGVHSDIDKCDYICVHISEEKELLSMSVK